MTTNKKKYYDILGVDAQATPSQIKAAYKKAAMRYHPDKNLSEKRAQAEAMFKEVGEAYDVLKDPAKRAAYDEERKHPHAPTQTVPKQAPKPTRPAPFKNAKDADRQRPGQTYAKPEPFRQPKPEAQRKTPAPRHAFVTLIPVEIAVLIFLLALKQAERARKEEEQRMERSFGKGVKTTGDLLLKLLINGLQGRSVFADKEDAKQQHQTFSPFKKQPMPFYNF